jgi:hypothetical protein
MGLDMGLDMGFIEFGEGGGGGVVLEQTSLDIYYSFCIYTPVLYKHCNSFYYKYTRQLDPKDYELFPKTYYVLQVDRGPEIYKSAYHHIILLVTCEEGDVYLCLDSYTL